MECTRNIFKRYKGVIKGLVTIAALALVFKQLPFGEFLTIIKSSAVHWLLAAFLAFNLSKILSSWRLLEFFRELKADLAPLQNLKLYYLGMFYNLSLPGGIGGDGYKVILVNRQFGIGLKALFSAVFFDRISGLAALVFLCLAIFFYFDLLSTVAGANLVIILLIVALWPCYYVFMKVFSKSFLSIFAKTSVQSVIVQLLQLVSAYFILKAIHVNEYVWYFLAIFLVSSIVAVLPLTIGGLGSRELVLFYATKFFPINEGEAVTLGLCFFLITLFSSLIGAVFSFQKVELNS